MIFEDDAVYFVSLPFFFAKEKNGRKPNTMRELSEMEIEQLSLANPTHVTISEVGTVRSFRREITDISTYRGRTIITWKHLED
jgi:hypothetical protein